MQLTKDAGLFTPRYTAYAFAHGRQPEEQMRVDHKATPADFMRLFRLWLAERWKEWHRLTWTPIERPKTLRDFAEFDLWLTIQVSDLP